MQEFSCRNVEAQKNRGGEISQQDYQGMITFYSCRDKEKSLEIHSKERGAFTHVLLQALEETKRQNKCLTVAELEGILIKEVPKLSPNQHPLAKVEPTYKSNFILFGEAQEEDVKSLYYLALQKAFVEKNEEEARQLLIHANLVAKGGNLDIINALQTLPSSPQVVQEVEPIVSPPQPKPKPTKYPVVSEVELKSEKGIDYTKLRDLLAAGMWKEADRETIRIMLEATRRTQEGYVRIEDIDQFPRTDLDTIDQLWRRYSYGRFGFSVQKRLYQDLKGTREYNEKIWREFCQRVGWRVGESWRNHPQELNFSLEAPKGHLPWVGVVWTGNNGHVLISHPGLSQWVILKRERGVDYTKLRDLLNEKKWKEADQETAKVMLQAAGRESEGWLNIEDLNNFPCEDLRTINQLWLHYSKGKFGFSVQKEIYESLGGTKDYNEEAWENFCDRIGWRKGGNYLDYSDLTFKLELAPKAHLPWLFGWWELLEWCIFFSRAKTCNL